MVIEKIGPGSPIEPLDGFSGHQHNCFDQRQFPYFRMATARFSANYVLLKTNIRQKNSETNSELTNELRSLR